MKITKLEVESFKRVRAVTIKPDGSLITVGGANAAGKSSTLDAIEAALGGSRHAPGDPIRHGSKSARIVVETDEITVTRKFTAKGSTLEVKAKDGAVFPSPQEMLSTLIGPISFDPLSFVRLPPVEQAETLRKLVGLDLSAEDAARQTAYDKRTEVGREIKRLEGGLANLAGVPDDTPDAEVSVAELAAEIERRQTTNAANAERRHALISMRADAKRCQEDIASLEEQLEVARARMNEISAKGKALSAQVAGLVDEDTTEIRDRIATAEQTNRAVRAKHGRAKLQTELDAAIDESEKLSQRITEIDGVKADATARASYPVQGLAVGDDGIAYNGVPFAQASSAEQLRVSVAIGLALNPKLKVLLIRDGSLLDERNLAVIATMAEEAGAQVWLERVSSDGAGCSVLIEDGAVSATENKVT